jgi:hypothetical protein
MRPFVVMIVLSRVGERSEMACRFVGVLLIAIVISSGAMAQQTFRQLEDVNEFERALAVVDTIKQRKKLQCFMAIANGRLCGCLSRTLPVDTYIRSYGSLASSSPEYEQLSAVNKVIVVQCLKESR